MEAKNELSLIPIHLGDGTIALRCSVFALQQ